MANYQQIATALTKILCPENKRKGLLKYFCKPSYDYSHQAIAILGDWGVGKTYLWNQFYEKNKRQLFYKKYAYVSLFGIKDIEELKLKIATEIHSIKSNGDVFKIKKLGKFLSSLHVDTPGASINIGSSLISSLLLSDMKDTLVCFDDLERRSESLQIGEIMGLVNYLIQERNCSVVCLLNNDEISDEKYENYKEKVFYHELLLDESLDIIQNIFKENREIAEKFYLIFDVKNIRFYEQANSYYNIFIKKISDDELSQLSKDDILSSFLLLMASDKMPNKMKFDLKWLVDEYSNKYYIEYLEYFSEEKERKELTDKEQVKVKIDEFYRHFKMDKWQNAILKFIQSYELTPDIEIAIEEDLFKENSLKNKHDFEKVINEYYNLKINEDYTSRLSKVLLKNLDYKNISTIDIWCSLLKNIGGISQAEEIYGKLKARIDQEIDSNLINRISDVYPIKKPEEDDLYNYIEKN